MFLDLTAWLELTLLYFNELHFQFHNKCALNTLSHDPLVTES